MASHSFPDPVFESLLERLARVVEITRSPTATHTPQARQALFHATSTFKDGLEHAKEIARSLPGGELCIEEQAEVIAMLEKLRDAKRAQLLFFASQDLVSSSMSSILQADMEIDSTASSPHD